MTSVVIYFHLSYSILTVVLSSNSFSFQNESAGTFTE